MRRARRQALGYQVGLIGFTSLLSFLRLSHYAVFMHPRYLPRALLVLATSLASTPLRLWERLRHGRRVAAVHVEAPIFVIGHWRSGTTHLHNLMSQDPSLGYLTMFQAMVPGCSLVSQGWLQPLLSRIVPTQRPMDNVVWPSDAPQEEEIPLAKLTPYPLYVRFLFPRRAPHLFRRYVLLEGAPRRVVAELRRKYRRLLQTATLHAGGRRLVLKNPVNTARIRFLLELFPQARFIHVSRSPYDVFASTRHMHQQMLPLTTLQTLAGGDRSDAILTLYEDLMRRYLEDRGNIPAGHLAEVRFEDLERDPVGQIEAIYQTLGLPGYDAARPAVEAYVATQRSYTKNRLDLSAADRERIEARCGFAFDAFGYSTETSA